MHPSLKRHHLSFVLAVVLAMLLSSALAVQFVNLAMANFIPPPTFITIAIHSPVTGREYTVNTVNVNLTLYKPKGGYLKDLLKEAKYSLDSVDHFVTLGFLGQTVPDGVDPRGAYSLSYAETLTGLSEGYHTIIASVTSSPAYGSSTDTRSEKFTVSFLVDAIHPRITVLSPQNRTYLAVQGLSVDIPLNFTATEKDLQTGYSHYRLDGQADVTIHGNTTLTGLHTGSHNLTVHVKDEAGNSASDIVYFNVEAQRIEPPEPQQPPESSESQQPAGFSGSTLPMELGYVIVVVAAVSVIAIVGFMLLRRKNLGGVK